MARVRYQKIKLLCLYELLKQEADEAHPLRTNDLCAKLAAMDIPCDRRILKEDIDMLNELGFEIMSTTVGHQNAFYVEDRGFSVPELKIMIDAVQAAAFIPKDKTTELTQKIAALGGTHRAELLLDNLVCFNTRKHTNGRIYYSIEALEEAIRLQRQASFFYYDLNENHEKVFRKNKKRYVVNPVALIYNEDNYYLMTFSSKYDGICNYRVDRMEEVKLEDEPVVEGAAVYSGSISAYTEQVFRMYGGPEEECVLEFDRSLIGVIYDRFGEDTQIMKGTKGTCLATVKVQVSPTFWGWLFQFPEKMKILSPEPMVEECRAQVARLAR